MELLIGILSIVAAVVLLVFAFKLGWRLLKLFLGVALLAIVISLIVYLVQNGFSIFDNFLR